MTSVMRASSVLSKKPPIKNSQSKQETKARSRSISLGQLPRSFEFSEDFLANSAAAAYQNNPAYVAIEKETLNAVAPFLELAKRRERSTSNSSSTPFTSRAYAYGSSLASSNTSVVDLSSPMKTHNRTVSGSSFSLDDFRNGLKVGSNLPSFIIPEDEQTVTAVTTSPHSFLASDTSHSTCQAISESGSPMHKRSTNHVSKATNYAMPYVNAQESAYDLSPVTPHHLELMQNRLRSLHNHTDRARKTCAVTAVPIIAPDPSFLLTKFVHDSVRLYSPSKQEVDEKFRLRADLEAILQVVQPTASLIVFGSVKNGLALANADLDLMVVDDSSTEDQLHDLHVDLPNLYAEALRTQGYAIKLLTKTRIPLIKITREYIAGTFSVDISFDNPLAVHNTRLMATYNACDPRFGVLVMFIKLWARARQINDSFAGTLKSYGYMIMLIYYLQNKASPALLPNLQMISGSGRALSADELECQGFDIWYAKDVSRMHAIQQNSQSVGELLEGFFSHFAYEFDYRDWVISINVFGGLQTKESKRWTQLVEHLNESGSARVKDRFILCVSDPFEISHNVARTVTRAGLYEIRGSMMAAVRAIRGNKLADLLAPSV